MRLVAIHTSESVQPDDPVLIPFLQSKPEDDFQFRIPISEHDRKSRQSRTSGT